MTSDECQTASSDNSVFALQCFYLRIAGSNVLKYRSTNMSHVYRDGMCASISPRPNN